MYTELIVIIDSGWQSFALDKSWFSSSGFLLVPRFATTRSSNLLKNIRNPSNSATRDSLNAYFCLDLWQSFESQIEFPYWQKLSITTRVPSGSWRGQWWKTFTTTQAGCFLTRWLDFLWQSVVVNMVIIFLMKVDFSSNRPVECPSTRRIFCHLREAFPEKKPFFWALPKLGGGGGCQIDFDTFLKVKKLAGVLHAGGGIVWQCPEGAF